MKDLKLQADTIKLLEESIGDVLQDTGKDFWEDSRSTGNQNKNKQMGLHQPKKLLFWKGNHQPSREAANRMENICELYNW